MHAVVSYRDTLGHGEFSPGRGAQVRAPILDILNHARPLSKIVDGDDRTTVKLRPLLLWSIPNSDACEWDADARPLVICIHGRQLGLGGRPTSSSPGPVCLVESQSCRFVFSSWTATDVKQGDILTYDTRKPPGTRCWIFLAVQWR